MTRREGGKALAAAEAIGRENLGTLDELIREVAKRVGPRVLEWRVVWGIEPLIGLIVMHTAIVTARQMRLGELAEEMRADKTELERLRADLERVRPLRIVQRSLEPLVDPQVHTPARQRGYLAAHGWTRWMRREDVTGWEHQAQHGRVEHVGVLESTDEPDFASYTAAQVCAVAEVHGLGELQVLAGIAEAADA